MDARVAVVGAGYWGKNLLRNFQELGALQAICESDEQNGNLKPYQSTKLYTKYSELLADEEVEAVAIAAPAVRHYDMVRQALESGKDVYVEKPLALTVEEGQDIVELVDKTGRILMVGHILQYHPAVIKLKELIVTGELGKIQYIYSNRLNIGKLRTEENILWSFAPHDISIILMLLDDEPVNVSAFGGDYLNNGIYDTTLTSLEFRNGVKAHIFVSWLHPFKEQKLIVVGSKAMAVFDDVSVEKLFLYPHKIQWQNGKIPIAQKADHKVISIDKTEPLKAELSHFLECIKERKRPKTDSHEGLRVLKILETAELALSNGHKHLRNDQLPVSPVSNLPQSPLAPGPSPVVFIHDTARVDDGVAIGEGTKIWHFSHVLKGSKIGKKCTIGQNVVIGPDVTIGEKCKIQNNVSVFSGVTLEDEVFCGPSCVFTNVYNPRAFIERKHEFRPTLVKRGATIGANTTIVCGVTIGEYAMIGAGAVVKADVPAYAIMAGIPARQKGWTCKCGTTLKFHENNALCAYCGNEYILDLDKLMIIKE